MSRQLSTSISPILQLAVQSWVETPALCWVGSRNLLEEPVQTVKPSALVQKHVGALSGYYGDPMILAELDGLRANRTYSPGRDTSTLAEFAAWRTLARTDR
jgi:hypothetical protein